MGQDIDVLVHGTCTTDILLSGLSRLPAVGEEIYSPHLGYSVGGSFITAATLARLGVRVGMLCPLGTDHFSQFVRDTMNAESVVNLSFETNQSQANVSVCMNLPNDRAIVSYSDELNVGSFTCHSVAVLRDTTARVIHISASRDVADVISQARQSGIYISMDLAWDEDWLRSETIWDIVSKADLFMPNEREACTITGTGTAQEAIHVLKRNVPNVVIKLGEKGALCWGKDDSEPGIVSAITVPDIVDTTGAGDNFDAGVLYGMLRHLDLRACVLIGNYCGSESVRGIGGTGHTASYSGLQKFLRGN